MPVGGGASTPPLDLAVAGGGSSAQGEPAMTQCAVAALGNPGQNASTNFALWLSERGPRVDRFQTGAPLEALTADTLSSYQVVLLDWLPEGTLLGVSADQLSAWVQAGGRLIALSGYVDNVSDPTVTNTLLQPLSLAFDTSRNQTISGQVTELADHPITAGLASGASFSGIPFTGGWPVTFADADVPVTTLNGSVVGIAALRGPGKAFVFGDEWITFDSEWAKTPEIERLWFNVFDWFGGCELSPPVVH